MTKDGIRSKRNRIKNNASGVTQTHGQYLIVVNPKYQRCTECGWKVGTGEWLARCPKCGGFLILKSTRHKSSPNPKYRRKVNGERLDEGYRLHRDPKGKGWSFVEGKSEKSSPAFLSNEDARRINACAVRRGLVRSPKSK